MYINGGRKVKYPAIFSLVSFLSCCLALQYLTDRYFYFTDLLQLNGIIGSCFVWMWNMLSYSGKNISVWKLNAQENILDKSYEVSKQFKMLCKQELCDLYRSPGIVRMVKSKSLQRAGHVIRMRKANICSRLHGKPSLKTPSRKTKKEVGG